MANFSSNKRSSISFLSTVGLSVTGALVGVAVTGEPVGSSVGFFVGDTVGESVGYWVGFTEKEGYGIRILEQVLKDVSYTSS